MRMTRRGRRLRNTLLTITVITLWWKAGQLPDLCLTRGGYVDCTTLQP